MTTAQQQQEAEISRWLKEQRKRNEDLPAGKAPDVTDAPDPAMAATPGSAPDLPTGERVRRVARAIRAFRATGEPAYVREDPGENRLGPSESSNQPTVVDPACPPAGDDFDPIESAMRRHPGLTREAAEAMAEAFGF
jgi:hypothetical protein